jgi:hypothetical protein
VLAAAIFATSTWWLGVAEQRTCDIRRALGTHPLGSCDPVTLKGQAREAFAVPPGRRFGTLSYAEAVPLNLARGRYSEAMWAARLTAALEDPVYGEELTDQVLADPGMQAALDAVRRDRKCWGEVMMTDEEREEFAREQEEMRRRQAEESRAQEQRAEQARQEEEWRRRQEEGIREPAHGQPGSYGPPPGYAPPPGPPEPPEPPPGHGGYTPGPY